MKDDGILIPVDFTEVSENAVSYAIGLAQKLKSKLVFVHAYSVAYPSGTPIGMATMAHNVTDTTASQEKIHTSHEKITTDSSAFDYHQKCLLADDNTGIWDSRSQNSNLKK